MNKIKVLFIAGALFLLPAFAGAVSPADFGLKEGDVIRATNDIDVYIVNDWGYKRLFLNPEIFNLYGHLGFDKVKTVSASARDAFPTSGLFRVDGDTKVYGLDIQGEDVAVLRWVNTTGEQAVSDDPNFFKKVFVINATEKALYNTGTPFSSVNQIPNYSRVTTPVVLNKAVVSASNLASTTLISNAKNVKLLSVDFDGNGSVSSLKVKRLGFQPSSSYQNVFLFKNGVRVTDPKTFSGSDSVATFSNLNLTAPFKLDVVVDFNGATTGSPAQIELQGDYNGLSLKSNSFNFATVTGASLTVASNGTVDDVVVGQKGAKVGKVKFTNSLNNEDLVVKSLRVINNGDADISNLKLVIGDQTFGAAFSGKDYFDFSLDIPVADGKSKSGEFFADISADADNNDKVKLAVENSYDVFAVGSVYGFGVSVSPNGLVFDEVNVAGNGSLTSVKALQVNTEDDEIRAVWGSTVSIAKFELEADETEGFLVDNLVIKGASLSDNVDKVLLTFKNKSGSDVTVTEDVNGDTNISFDFYGSNRPYVAADGKLAVAVSVKLLDGDEDGVDRLSNFKLKLDDTIELTGDSSVEEYTYTGSDVEAKDGLFTSGTILVPAKVSGFAGDFDDKVQVKFAVNGDVDAAFGTTSNVYFDVKWHDINASTSLDWTAKLDGVEVSSGSLDFGDDLNVVFTDSDYEVGALEDSILSIEFDNLGDVNSTDDNGYIKFTLDQSNFVDDFDGDAEGSVLQSWENGLQWQYDFEN